jgi:uncharacterized damage-inducible protein DinB
MDSSTLQAMFRFNTWANEQLREAISTADRDTVQRPLDMWFNSVFKILAHIYSAEALWLGRLCGSATSGPLTAPAEPADIATLVEAWRAMDARWESYVASLSSEQLISPVTVRRRDGSAVSHEVWKAVMQIGFHGTEHRGHATVGMTQLGIAHGPQDFLDQFRAPVTS